MVQPVGMSRHAAMYGISEQQDSRTIDNEDYNVRLMLNGSTQQVSSFERAKIRHAIDTLVDAPSAEEIRLRLLSPVNHEFKTNVINTFREPRIKGSPPGKVKGSKHNSMLTLENDKQGPTQETTAS